VTEAHALLHDGVTAVPHQAWVRLMPATLRIQRRYAPPLDWPVATLRVIDRLPHQLRVAPQGSSERLVVGDPAMIAALDIAMAPARRAALGRRFRMALASMAAVPLLGVTLWFGWPLLADATARAIPQSWESPIGNAVMASIADGRPRCTAPEGLAALQRLAERLAAAQGLEAVPRVQVLDGPEINALAAPGGRVVVFRGLLDRASAPDEIAGVLAHEFGHVRHRHGMRALVRAMGIGVFASILIGGSDLGTIAVALMTLSYTRAFEEEADDSAAAVLRDTGFGTEGLAAFFTRMDRATGGAGRGISAYLHTHPQSGDRAERLMRAEGSAPRVPAMSAEDWAALRAICQRIERPGKP